MTRLSVERLGSAPELAVLAVLETAAATAVLALAAAYPELQDDLDPADGCQVTREALSVVEQARTLGLALARYRSVLLCEHRRKQLMHF